MTAAKTPLSLVHHVVDVSGAPTTGYSGEEDPQPRKLESAFHNP